MIRVSFCKDNRLIEKDIAWDSFLEKYRFKSGLIWIDMDQADDNEWLKLCEYFDLDRMTILTSKHYTEYPVIEEYPEYTFIATHIYELNPTALTSIKKELDIFISNNFIITVHRGEMPLISKVRESLSSVVTYLRGDHAMLATYILLEHLNSFSYIVDLLEQRVERLEGDILHDAKDTILDDIINFRSYCNELKRNIRPICDQYHHLSLFESEQFTPRSLRSLKILEDRAFAVREKVDIIRDSLSSLQNSYLTVVSNKMNEISFRMNEVIHQLTLISTIFLPLSFITGWFGMNFNNMPLMNSQFGYPVVITATVIIVLLLNSFFKRRGWYFKNDKRKK